MSLIGAGEGSFIDDDISEAMAHARINLLDSSPVGLSPNRSPTSLTSGLSDVTAQAKTSLLGSSVAGATPPTGVAPSGQNTRQSSFSSNRSPQSYQPSPANTNSTANTSARPSFSTLQLFESTSSQPSSRRLSLSEDLLFSQPTRPFLQSADSFGPLSSSEGSSASAGFRIPLRSLSEEPGDFQQPSVAGASRSFSVSSSYAQAQAHRAYLDELQATGDPVFASAAALSAADAVFASDSSSNLRLQGKPKRPGSYSYGQSSASAAPRQKARFPTPVDTPSNSPFHRYGQSSDNVPASGQFFRSMGVSSLLANEATVQNNMPLIAPSLPGVQDWLSNVLSSFDFRNASHVALLPQLALDQKGSRFIQHVRIVCVSYSFIPCFLV